MSKFENIKNGVVVSVADEKDARFADGWKRLGAAVRSDAPDESWKVADLKGYAADNGIDLGDAKNKAGILAAIAAGPAVDPDGDSNDDSNDDGSDDSSDN